MNLKFSKDTSSKERVNFVMGLVGCSFVIFLDIPLTIINVYSNPDYSFETGAFHLVLSIIMLLVCLWAIQAIVKGTHKPEVIEIEKEIIKYETIQVPSTKDITNTFGFVYIIRDVDGLYYKIGKSKRPDDRKKRFDVKLPFAVEDEILLETEDMHKLESALHRHFASKRIRGEWFELSQADINWIRDEFKGEG